LGSDALARFVIGGAIFIPLGTLVIVVPKSLAVGLFMFRVVAVTVTGAS
jgi:hypothetical protein